MKLKTKEIMKIPELNVEVTNIFDVKNISYNQIRTKIPKGFRLMKVWEALKIAELKIFNKVFHKNPCVYFCEQLPMDKLDDVARSILISNNRELLLEYTHIEVTNKMYAVIFVRDLNKTKETPKKNIKNIGRTLEIPELNIKVQTKISQKGRSFNEIRIPNGLRLLTAKEITFLFNNYKKELNMITTSEYFEQPFKLNDSGKWAPVLESNRELVGTSECIHSDRKVKNRGVRFVRDLKNTYKVRKEVKNE